LLSSAELIHQIHESGKWGVKVSGGVEFDWPAIQKRKDKVVRQLRGGVGSLFKGRGVALHEGVGKLDGPGKIAVQPTKGAAKQLTADRIIVAVGSRPTQIPGWPNDGQVVCTSDEAVHWATLPKKLLVVGGGVIGCEFACMMNSYGVDVTIVEMMPKLLPGLDEEVGDTLEKIFRARGMAIHLDTKVEDMQVIPAGGAAKAKLEHRRNARTSTACWCPSGGRTEHAGGSAWPPSA
jgi:dihydrolipoamide dehydrogenase